MTPLTAPDASRPVARVPQAASDSMSRHPALEALAKAPGPLPAPMADAAPAHRPETLGMMARRPAGVTSAEHGPGVHRAARTDTHPDHAPAVSAPGNDEPMAQAPAIDDGWTTEAVDALPTQPADLPAPDLAGTQPVTPLMVNFPTPPAPTCLQPLIEEVGPLGTWDSEDEDPEDDDAYDQDDEATPEEIEDWEAHLARAAGIAEHAFAQQQGQSLAQLVPDRTQLAGLGLDELRDLLAEAGQISALEELRAGRRLLVVLPTEPSIALQPTAALAWVLGIGPQGRPGMRRFNTTWWAGMQDGIPEGSEADAVVWRRWRTCQDSDATGQRCFAGTGDSPFAGTQSPHLTVRLGPAPGPDCHPDHAVLDIGDGYRFLQALDDQWSLSVLVGPCRESEIEEISHE